LEAQVAWNSAANEAPSACGGWPSQRIRQRNASEGSSMAPPYVAAAAGPPTPAPAHTSEAALVRAADVFSRTPPHHSTKERCRKGTKAM
jgi:hypothetical protein